MKYLIVMLFIITACHRGDHGDPGNTIVGPPGPAAQPCSVITATNGALITCPDGTQQFISNGLNGSNGNDGLQGPKGDQGLPGSNGVDATPVTWVQFCPGTTSYPTKFIEGGLCFQNNLYAVYSINNGFLTLIPPGNYNSNALGSSCSFTVLPNCQIQY